MSGKSQQNIRSSLKELHIMMLAVQEERNRNSENLSNINKTHEKMRHETRVSTYFKSKLKSLYRTAMADAKNESELIQRAMEKIFEIKQAAGENVSGKPKAKVEEPRKGMRRGVLMSLLQQNANDLPLWKRDEQPPPLCGAVPAEQTYICQPGDHVVARVKYPDAEEQFILAEIISYNSSTGKYDVEDIDYSEEEGKNEKERHQLSRRRVIPLPLYKADPQHHAAEAMFQLKQTVLALYPQTTCFYKAIVHAVPKHKDMDYTVLFEDTSYADGYSPPLTVPQRYVVTSKKPR